MARGHRYTLQFADPDPNETRRGARGCPALDPLPAGATLTAEAAARAAAPTLYGVKPGDITAATARPRPPAASPSVRSATGDGTQLRRQACGDEPLTRSLVVALMLRGQPPGSLMVGFHAGQAIVWNQLR